MIYFSIFFLEVLICSPGDLRIFCKKQVNSLIIARTDHGTLATTEVLGKIQQRGLTR